LLTHRAFAHYQKPSGRGIVSLMTPSSWAGTFEEPSVKESLATQSPPTALNTALGIRTLAGLMKVPPHTPNLDAVVSRLSGCLQAAAEEFANLRTEMERLNASLSEGMLNGQDSTLSAKVLWGLSTSYPVWTVLGDRHFSSSTEFRVVIGLCAIYARIRAQPINVRQIKDLQKLQRQQHEGALNESEFEVQVRKKIACLTKKLQFASALVKKSASATEINDQTLLLSTLTSRLSSLRVVERQAAQRSNELTDSELRAYVSKLVTAIRTGEKSNALVESISFCIGLPLHISKRVPISMDRPKDRVMWIDPKGGVVCIDLSSVFDKLAKKSTESHLVTSFLLVRPLPLLIHNELQEALSVNPNIKSVADLVEEVDTSRRRLLAEGVHHSSTVAQFLASAPGAALRATKDRLTSAFATLGFQLICESDLHYLSTSVDSIWAACNQLYRTVGYGHATPSAEQDMTHVGSKLTPTHQAIQTIFKTVALEVNSSRCGRRYTLSSIIDFHNRYAKYFCAFLHFTSGGRDRKVPYFSASTWTPDSLFGQSGDKPCGISKGYTPIPVSRLLSEQISLWHSHLECLGRRLRKLDATKYHQAICAIEQIRNQEDVNLLILLGPDGELKTLTSNEILEEVKHSLSGDWGRHFWPSMFQKHDLPFECSQDFLRHHAAGHSNHSLTSTSINWRYLQRTGQVIDKVLQELSIQPLSGLSRGV
jgi:hypothetical protein